MVSLAPFNMEMGFLSNFLNWVRLEEGGGGLVVRA